VPRRHPRLFHQGKLIPLAVATLSLVFVTRVQAQSLSHRVSFELIGNHVYVQARLPDSEPLWFLLDTGATASYFDAERARSMGLGERGDTIVGTTVVFPGLEVSDQDLLIQPLGFWAYDGHTVDGLLGYDFIRRFVVELDYVSRVVTFHDPEGFDYSGTGDVLPLFMLEDDSGGKVPLVRVTIVQQDRAPLEGQFIADIAVRAALSFNTPFVRSHELLRSSETILALIGGGAMVQESMQHHGRIDTVRLGRFHLNRPIAVFFQDDRGIVASPEFDGVIGGDILRRFKAIFDYSREQLILEPNSQLDEPFEHDMSGALLIAEGADFKSLKVKRVMDGSPAAAAGLREGDVILAIGGQRTSDLSLELVKQMFRRPGRTYRLELDRAGETIHTEIQLRRLI
jgi:hypothetical protein